MKEFGHHIRTLFLPLSFKVSGRTKLFSKSLGFLSWSFLVIFYSPYISKYMNSSTSLNINTQQIQKIQILYTLKIFSLYSRSFCQFYPITEHR